MTGRKWWMACRAALCIACGLGNSSARSGWVEVDPAVARELSAGDSAISLDIPTAWDRSALQLSVAVHAGFSRVWIARRAFRFSAGTRSQRSVTLSHARAADDTIRELFMHRLELAPTPDPIPAIELGTRQLDGPGGASLSSFARPGVARCPDGDRSLEEFPDPVHILTCIAREPFLATVDGFPRELSHVQVYDTRHRLTWVWLAASYALEPVDHTIPGWPAGAPPYFEPNREPGPPVRSVAIELFWSGDDVAGFQIWTDERMTGAYVELRADGSPATLGYYHDGQPHGFWYFLDPDAHIVAAKLFALGTFVQDVPLSK